MRSRDGAERGNEWNTAVVRSEEASRRITLQLLEDLRAASSGAVTGELDAAIAATKLLLSDPFDSAQLVDQEVRPARNIRD